MPARALSAVLDASSAGGSQRNVCRAAAASSHAASASDWRRYAGETSRGVPQGSPRTAASATQSSGRAAGLNRPFAKRQRCSRESEQARKCSGWPGSSASTARQRSCSLARIAARRSSKSWSSIGVACLAGVRLQRSVEVERRARSRRCRRSSRAARRARRRRAAVAGSAAASGARQMKRREPSRTTQRLAVHTLFSRR